MRNSLIISTNKKPPEEFKSLGGFISALSKNPDFSFCSSED